MCTLTAKCAENIPHSVFTNFKEKFLFQIETSPAVVECIFITLIFNVVCDGFWYFLLSICQVILNALNNFLTDSKMTWPVVSVEAPCLLLASSLHSAIQVTILIKLQTFKNSVALFVTKSSSNFSATEEAQL